MKKYIKKYLQKTEAWQEYATESQDNQSLK